jgi:aminomethyltransferase
MNLYPSPRLRPTPFQKAVNAAGLTDVSVYNQMLLPVSFGDPAAEYRRLTEGVAIWDVAAERQVEVRGPDADACVQYLTARDLSRMKHGQGKYVAMCDHQGRILNDPVLLKLSDRYWFSIADNNMLLWVKAIAAERGFDVDVCEPDVSPLAVQGPLAEDLIVDLFGPHVSSLKYFWFIETELQGIPLVLCRSGWSKQGGFELFLRDGSRGEELWNLVVEAGERYGIGPGAPNGSERIESGLLSWGGDTTPDSNPFEAGMARYVDVDIEADYIGKAALAKMLADGGPARLLTGLLIDPVADGGEADVPWPSVERSAVWSGGEQVGTMSSVAYSPKLGQLVAVAQVAAELAEAGAEVEVETPSGRRTGRCRPFPLVS